MIVKQVVNLSIARFNKVFNQLLNYNESKTSNNYTNHFVGRGKIKCLNLGELDYLNLMNFITIEWNKMDETTQEKRKGPCTCSINKSYIKSDNWRWVCIVKEKEIE